jgi:(p)ppGpp synthase/HD superfamily hydrolase
MTKKALRIAFDAHKEQTDKAGLPYIYHPLHIAEHIGDDEALICTALLHDVVEDTAITFEELVKVGISDEIITALRLLTHDEAIPYMEYVQNIKGSGNRIALAIKLADIRHNSDTSRLTAIDERAKKRLEQYRAAIDLLES